MKPLKTNGPIDKMEDFPLHLFLTSLSAYGIKPTISDYERISLALQTEGPWTIIRLRDMLLALLAKNQEQQEILLKRFDTFFTLKPNADNVFKDIDIERVLTYVQQPAKGPPKSVNVIPEPQRGPSPLESPQKHKISLGSRIALSCLLILCFAAFCYFRPPRLFQIKTPLIPPHPIKGSEINKTPKKKIKKTTTSFTDTEHKRTYSNIPYVKDIHFDPMTTPLKIKFGIFLFFGMTLLFYALYLWRSRLVPEDKEAYWEEGGPRHFPLGSIGSQPAPIFDEAVLNRLADSMGYFLSEQPGKRLNVNASIEATVRKGGLPSLVFYARTQIRSLLILEDALAEAITWNPIAANLAEGMARRGVPVLYGRFTGLPDQFTTESGTAYQLEDLEDHRHGHLLLIFTDSKGFYRPEGAFILETLSHWPMAAWMELREPYFWDESSAFPVRYGIPIYPATPIGTMKAVRNFLTEQSEEGDFSCHALARPSAPNRAGTKLEAYIEQLLGDALLWGQDCAMFQPVSQGLADALRRQFHPHLPYERIERLYALPGTIYNVSGLRFSFAVLKVLRTGFMALRGQDEQEKVLRFILEKIQLVEPEDKNSLAHLTWEAVKERQRMELEKGYDLGRLAQLHKTPLGPFIRASLDNFGPPEQPDKAPLRYIPANKHAKQRLARLADHFGIPKLRFYPMAWRQWLTLGVLFLVSLGSFLWTLPEYIKISNQPAGRWEIIGPSDIHAQLEIFDMDKWKVEASGNIQKISAKPLLIDRDYRLIVYGNGCKTIREIKAIHFYSSMNIVLGEQGVEYPCREEYPDIGLIVERSPDQEVAGKGIVGPETWKERLGEKAPKNRLMSVGLEISSPGVDYPSLQNFRNILLQTSSVDILYRIQPDSKGEWYIEEALEHIQRDLDPWIEQSQVIWWTAGSVPESLGGAAGIINLVLKFDRSILLGQRVNQARMAKLEKLLEPREDILVTEQEIMQELGMDQQVDEKGNPIALIRKGLSYDNKVIKEKGAPNDAVVQGKGKAVWTEKVFTSQGHAGSILSAAFSPDGNYIISGSRDKTLRLWEKNSGRMVRVFEGHTGVVSSAAFSPDGKYILSGSGDKTLRLWEKNSGKIVRVFEGHTGIVSSLAFSPDGSYILSGSHDNTVRLWEKHTGRIVRLFNGHTDIVSSAAFSPDGNYIISGSRDKTLRLWEKNSGRMARVFEGHTDVVSSAVFSPDGNYILSGSGDKTLRLWEKDSGRMVRVFEGHTYSVWSVAFSPDGNYILSGSGDKTLRLWEKNSGRMVRAFEGHTDSVLAVAFSPYGNYILSGSWDKTLRLWEKDSGRMVRVFEGHTDSVWSVAFSPDGNYILSGSRDKTLRLW